MLYVGLGAAAPAPAQTYDLILRNARVVDGTGSPWFRGDVAIRGDSIAQIAPSIFGKAAPHPRSYGTFARVLGVYVREKKVITLEEAVKKMSAIPAARIGLTDRGVLRPGMKADIAVFDPGRVRDAATFEKPHQYAEGFLHVIVNGQVVYENGAMTDARPGRVLYGPARVRQ